MAEFNAIEYLEGMYKATIDRIESLARDGKPEDAVKLKANSTLLNKLLPDRTKMELDIASKSPYEMLLRNLENGEDKAGHESS